jgi:hypothetical protein
MSDQTDFEALLPKLQAIAPEAIRKQDVPIVEAIKEGEIMAAAAIEDEEKLIGADLEPEVIPELNSAVGALRYSEARVIAATGEVTAQTRLWNEQEPQAYDLRDDLLDIFGRKLRKTPDAGKAVKRIRKGTGSGNMLLDLAALHEMGDLYREELTEAKFDFSLSDKAGDMAETLGALYAKIYLEPGSSPLIDLRNRSFTYMRIQMSEVLDAAEFAFRKDPARLEFYYSAYRSRRRNKATVPEEATAATPAQ